MKILLVSSEITPFAKTGGLADVSAAISRFLGRTGHDVKPLMPLYRRVESADWPLSEVPGLQDVTLELGPRSFTFSVLSSPLPDSDVDVLFLHCPELFGRDLIYTSDSDEHQRFGLFSRAALAICQRLGWSPDVIHCNDWHTGLLPLYLKAGYSWDELFRNTKTVLTIHNIGYQGTFGAGAVDELGFEDHRHLFHQERLAAGAINLLETGILYADALTTVSETYSREIQTPELGMGLDGLLAARADSLIGIVNGVDYGEWNPADDPLLPHHFDADDLSGKERNKAALLEEFSLAEGAEVPTFGIVSRLTAQKGFELLPDILPVVLRQVDARLVVLGSGEPKLEAYFQWLCDAFPDRVGFYEGYSNELAHLIEAGSDAFLMPSRYEPCGLNQMYSLRYGTVPIVRRTGGLADTVEDYDPVTGEGTGFVFDEFESEALLDAMRRALECYRDRTTWRRIVLNGMARDTSWDRQGRHYVDLYEMLAAR
jgi:starch synthase